MAPPIIAFPNYLLAKPQFATVVVGGGSWLPQAPLANLFLPRITKVARSTDLLLTSTRIDVDLGVQRQILLVAIPASNMTIDGRVRLTISRNADFSDPLLPPAWVDWWPRVYPYGQLPYGHPSWYDGKLSEEEADGYPTLVSAGMTVQDIGTRAVQVSGVDRYYEGRAGWGVRDYIGKARSDEYGVNPFLKPADAGDLAAYPDLCFADSGTGVRPSYAENPGLGSYSIFSSAHYASELSLSTSAKAILILQLGHNDQTNGAAFLPDVALGHNHIVSDFRATFPNGAVVVVQEGIKSGFGSGGGGFDGLIQWNTVQGPLAKLKMELFDGREAERIYLVHAFMHENMDASSLATSVDSTDPITGVVKRTVTDIVHQTGQTSREWANAVSPLILHLQATL